MSLLFFAFLFGKGDSKIWEYESEGYCENCLDEKLDIELSNWKKGGTKIELKAKLNPAFEQKIISVLLNKRLLIDLTADDRNSKSKKYEKVFDFSEPRSGDQISLVIENTEIYSSRLISDFKKTT